MRPGLAGTGPLISAALVAVGVLAACGDDTDSGLATDSAEPGDSWDSQDTVATDTQDSEPPDTVPPIDTADTGDSGPATDTADSAEPNSGSLDEHAFARLIGEHADGSAGKAVTAAGDFDGDGHQDILLGAHSDEYDDGHRGAVFLAFGPFSGDHLLSDVAVYERGVEEWEYLGLDVTGLGDTNGDGIASL